MYLGKLCEALCIGWTLMINRSLVSHALVMPNITKRMV